MRFAINSSDRWLRTVAARALRGVRAFVAAPPRATAPGAKARRAPSKQLPAARRNGARPSASEHSTVTSKPKDDATPNGRSGMEANNPRRLPHRHPSPHNAPPRRQGDLVVRVADGRDKAPGGLAVVSADAIPLSLLKAATASLAHVPVRRRALLGERVDQSRRRLRPRSLGDGGGGGSRATGFFLMGFGFG